MVRIKVVDVVGGPLCVSTDDGKRLHDRIYKELKRSRTVELSFKHVESVTSAFLNAAIGQLYGGDLTEEHIRAHLRVTDIDTSDMLLLKSVIDTAKQYFRDPQRFQRVRREVLGDDE